MRTDASGGTDTSGMVSTHCVRMRGARASRVLLLLLAAAAAVVAPTDVWGAASHPYACSSQLVSQHLSASASEVASMYLAPIEAGQAIIDAMLEAIGEPAAEYHSWHQWATSIAQLQLYSSATAQLPSAYYDPSPTRTGETFVGAYALNYTFDDITQDCSFLSQPSHSFNASCIIGPHSDSVTEYCTRHHPTCAPVNLTQPYGAGGIGAAYEDTHAVGCPHYCQCPTCYGDSMLNFRFRFLNKFQVLVPFYHRKYATTVHGWYVGWNDVMRYYPSYGPTFTFAELTNFAGNPTPYSLYSLLPVFMMSAGRIENPSGGPMIGDPYIDLASSGNMVTVNIPIRQYGHYFGNFMIDILMVSTATYLTELANKISPHALVFLIDAVGSDVISATVPTLDSIFCPDFCAGHPTGYDASAFALGGSAPTLLDSVNGFAALWPLLSASVASPGSASQSEARVLLHGVKHTAFWQTLTIHNKQWLLVAALPSIEIDAAALWSIRPTQVVLAQPNLYETDTIRTNDAAYPYADSSRFQMLTTFEVHNAGLANIAFQVSTPGVDWILIRPIGELRTPSQIAAAYGATDPTRPDSVIRGVGLHSFNTSDLLSTDVLTACRIGTACQLTFGVFVDFARADGRTSVTALLTPTDASTEAPTSGCFGTLVVPLLFRYATRIGIAHPSSALQHAVVSLTVITLVGLSGLILAMLHYRHEAVIKSSAPMLNVLSLLGAALTQLCALLFVLKPDEDSTICRLRVWALPFSLVLLFTPLLVKSIRIGLIFNQQKLAVQKLSDASLSIGILAAVLLSLLITGIHEVSIDAAHRSKYELVALGEAVPVPGAQGLGAQYTQSLTAQCTSSPVFQAIMLTYIFALTISGVIIAWKVRAVPNAFNESFHLLVACSFVLVYFALIVPLQFLLTDPTALAVLRAAGITLGVWITIAAVFAPKLVVLFADSTSTVVQIGSPYAAPDRRIHPSSKLGTQAAGAVGTVPSAVHGALPSASSRERITSS